MSPPPLASLTTLRLGGPPQAYVEATDEHTIVTAVRDAEPPVLVLAGGSNVVVADEGFPGGSSPSAPAGSRPVSDLPDSVQHFNAHFTQDGELEVGDETTSAAVVDVCDRVTHANATECAYQEAVEGVEADAPAHTTFEECMESPETTNVECNSAYPEAIAEIREEAIGGDDPDPSDDIDPNDPLDCPATGPLPIERQRQCGL